MKAFHQKVDMTMGMALSGFPITKDSRGCRRDGYLGGSQGRLSAMNEKLPPHFYEKKSIANPKNRDRKLQLRPRAKQSRLF